ncbi:MAG: serine/threonine protein kinase, partial [Pseudonocardia sp.]
YSLGATLYAAVEGAPPFGDGHGDTRHPTRLIDSDQARSADRAGPLAPVLQRLLDSDPAARPNALDARELCRDVANDTTAPSTPVESIHSWPIPPPSRPRRRGRLIAAALTCVLAITVALTIGLGRAQGSAPIPEAPRTDSASSKPATTDRPH